jgi:RNA polymerase sigma factor (sigma-70 family)
MPQYDGDDDCTLIERCRRGDQGAFRRIYVEYREVIRRACRWHRVPVSEADDVEQRVWEAFWRYPPELRRADALASWLWVTTSNECRRRGRRNVRTVPLDDVGEVADDACPAVDSGLVRAEDRKVAQRLLATLRPDEQRFISLVFDDARPGYRTVSQAIDRPVGSIGPTRQRILRKLRDTAAVGGLVA